MIKFIPDTPERENVMFNMPPSGYNEGVSIIIPIRGKHFQMQIDRCLHHVHTQRLKLYEIIVVEEDNSPKISIPHHKNVRYLFLQSNLGFCKSKCFNYGVAKSKYAKISGLDCDMITPANFFSYGDTSLSTYDASFIASDILYSDILHSDYDIYNWNGKRWSDRVNWQFHGGSFFITKRAYERIGGFNELFVGYGSEDSDFYHRVNKNLKVCTKKPFSLLHMFHDIDHRGDYSKNTQLYLKVKSMDKEKAISLVKFNNSFMLNGKILNLK